MKVILMERDPSYQYSSTALSLGGVRVQFSLRENILVSLYAQQVLEHFEEEMAVDGERPDISYRQAGYLFLIDSAGENAARSSLILQRQLGAEVEWWTPVQIKERYPFLNVSPWVGGTFGPRDGYLDPYGFLMAYRAKARSLGVEFLHDRIAAWRKKGIESRASGDPRVNFLRPASLSTPQGPGPPRSQKP